MYDFYSNRVKAESFACTLNITSGHIVAKFSKELWKELLFSQNMCHIFEQSHAFVTESSPDSAKGMSVIPPTPSEQPWPPGVEHQLMCCCVNLCPAWPCRCLHVPQCHH